MPRVDLHLEWRNGTTTKWRALRLVRTRKNNKMFGQRETIPSGHVSKQLVPEKNAESTYTYGGETGRKQMASAPPGPDTKK